MPFSFRKPTPAVSDLLPWSHLVAEGTAITKHGYLMATYRYTGQDLESSTAEELAAAAHTLNESFLPLTESWMVFFDTVRVPSHDYRSNPYPDKISALIDLESRQHFEGGHHFETSTYITFAQLTPSQRAQATARRFFLTGPETPKTFDWTTTLQTFEDRCNVIIDRLGSVFHLARLDSAQLLRHLHTCLTGKDHPIDLPDPPVHIDVLLASEDIVTGHRPTIGPRSMRVLSIDGFPAKSHPGITDHLSALPMAYRWSIRWIPQGRREAERELKHVRKGWARSTSGLAETVGLYGKDPHAAKRREKFDDIGASRLHLDAQEALASLTTGEVAFGHLSNTLILFSTDPQDLEKSSKEAQRICAHHGFPCRLEDINAMDAFMGSLPGNASANVRRPVLHTLNLAHILPSSTVWTGESKNPCNLFPSNSPPLFWAKTSGVAPFRGNLHVDDVGHAAIIGPTGAGKSVLLARLAFAFRQYPNSQVFLFDKGYSAQAYVLAAGGRHYDLKPGTTDGPAFSPFADINTDAALAWAIDWLLGLLELCGYNLQPADTALIHQALQALGDYEPESRNFTNLLPLIQNEDMRLLLKPYTLEGAYGNFLDATTDSFGSQSFQVFEMSHLLEAGDRIAAPTLNYLFHRINGLLQDNRPTVILIDEAWSFLTHPRFARQILTWLKEARKLNASVVLASQSLADLSVDGESRAIFDALPTKILLPNESALSPSGGEAYRELGLNRKQIRIVGTATPKRDYYWLSPKGRRLIDLELGGIAKAFLAVGGDRLAHVRRLAVEHGSDWPEIWLQHCGLHSLAAHLRQGAQR